mmetsp:Transcript_59430/g.173924  ORF Transcript_59430/g.173924 Transcript_59430/m.173924 type:complete len:258 (+) Transcript_59430:1379-2152(+)
MRSLASPSKACRHSRRSVSERETSSRRRPSVMSARATTPELVRSSASKSEEVPSTRRPNSMRSPPCTTKRSCALTFSEGDSARGQGLGPGGSFAASSRLLASSRPRRCLSTAASSERCWASEPDRRIRGRSSAFPSSSSSVPCRELRPTSERSSETRPRRRRLRLTGSSGSSGKETSPGLARVPRLGVCAMGVLSPKLLRAEDAEPGAAVVAVDPLVSGWLGLREALAVGEGISASGGGRRRGGRGSFGSRAGSRPG